MVCGFLCSTGIVITLLAIAIAVGVGLIVHFAENRKLECNFPDVHVDGVGKIQPQTGDRQTEQPDTPKPTQKPRGKYTPPPPPPKKKIMAFEL